MSLKLIDGSAKPALVGDQLQADPSSFERHEDVGRSVDDCWGYSRQYRVRYLYTNVHQGVWTLAM